MYQTLKNKEKTISVIGLGYVGLPLALALASRFRVIGFDLNAGRIEQMKQGIDPSEELENSAFEGKDIRFTADADALKEAQFHIVAVPTPVDEHKVPNLKAVLSASKDVGRALKKGDYVIFESTVYPGCTEEDCLPILEGESGLKLGQDFKLGYSPERINPGDKERTIEKILKIVSGSDEQALEEIAKVYGDIITAGIYRASSIKVAEAAKVIENAQRDLNISFVNELAIIFDRLGIDTQEVIEAAATKWNFLKFSPGLVGGARAAIAIARSGTGDELRARLAANARHFRTAMQRAGFDLTGADHPIIPVMLGDAKVAGQMAARMLDLGVYVTAFSYPVVPMGTARIRTQMNAAHSSDDIDRAVEAFVTAGREAGVVR